jgi:hypothetical protein
MLLVGALGVVFGDIGTSPIYAFRESLRAAGGVEAQATVLGILSLVFWASSANSPTSLRKSRSRSNISRASAYRPCRM